MTILNDKQKADEYFRKQCERLGPIDGLPVPIEAIPVKQPRRSKKHTPDEKLYDTFVGQYDRFVFGPGIGKTSFDPDLIEKWLNMGDESND